MKARLLKKLRNEIKVNTKENRFSPWVRYMETTLRGVKYKSGDYTPMEFELNTERISIELQHIALAEYIQKNRKMLRHRCMTDIERILFVQGRLFECTKAITAVRNGEGCKVGETYRFEYVHYACDDGRQEAVSFYRKLSDNNRLDEVFITDDELSRNFRIIKKQDRK